MSFPTKVIPLSSACKTWLNQTYALKTHSHSDLANRITVLENKSSVTLPDWANTIILKHAQKIHYYPPPSTTWNNTSSVINWNDNGVLNGDYYDYKISNILVCKLYKERVQTVYVSRDSTSQYTRYVNLLKDCYVNFIDGDFYIGIYRNGFVRQIQCGRGDDVGGTFIFCKSGDRIYVRNDAHVLTVTPLI